jgi:hypothetical protein
VLHAARALLSASFRMSAPGGDWACERSRYGGGVPFTLRVGATGLGLGVGCGVGIGFGSPLSLAGVPVVGSAASGVGAGLAQFRGVFGGAERRLRALLRAAPPALRGVSAGAGCGVGVGYGFGAGLFLKPSAGEALLRRAGAARDALAAKLPAAARQQLQQLQAQQQQQAQAQQQHAGGGAQQLQHGAAVAADADEARAAADARQSVRAHLRCARALARTPPPFFVRLIACPLCRLCRLCPFRCPSWRSVWHSSATAWRRCARSSAPCATRSAQQRRSRRGQTRGATEHTARRRPPDDVLRLSRRQDELSFALSFSARGARCCARHSKSSSSSSSSSSSCTAGAAAAAAPRRCGGACRCAHACARVGHANSRRSSLNATRPVRHTAARTASAAAPQAERASTGAKRSAAARGIASAHAAACASWRVPRYTNCVPRAACADTISLVVAASYSISISLAPPGREERARSNNCA